MENKTSTHVKAQLGIEGVNWRFLAIVISEIA